MRAHPLGQLHQRRVEQRRGVGRREHRSRARLRRRAVHARHDADHFLLLHGNDDARAGDGALGELLG
jgi:hypothetical protein